MKKVLVAGAALLLVGGMAASAAAEVNMSGDARVRWRYMDNYYKADLTQKDSLDKWDSRVRVKIKATAKGGAYAEGRIRMGDYTWDGVGAATYNGKGFGESKKDTSVWTDYAFLHVPLGDSGFAVRGGIQVVGFSKFLADDERADRFNIDYKSGPIFLKLLYDVMDENTSDFWNSEAVKAYGLIARYKADGMMVKAYARYQNDDRTKVPGIVSVSYDVVAADGTTHTITESVSQELDGPDKTGFIGDVHAEIGVGDTGTIIAEIAYKDSDVMRGSNAAFDDDGWGVYGQFAMKMGSISMQPMVGYTTGGYVADESFGFIMIGGDEPIMAARIGNSLGSAWFVGLPMQFQISEQLKAAANLAYEDFDIDYPGHTSARFASLWEISGSLTYQISEGADFTFKAGYMSPDIEGETTAAGAEDDGVFGAYGRFQIKF